jgi:ribonuclease HIII
MLTPRLTNCPECDDIPNLLEDIDCKITEISKKLYNNLIFSLNQSVNSDLIIDLTIYKRVLMHKYWDSNYAKSVNVDQIASKIKILKYK